jgi:hypothetical protein
VFRGLFGVCGPRSLPYSGYGILAINSIICNSCDDVYLHYTKPVYTSNLTGRVSDGTPLRAARQTITDSHAREFPTESAGIWCYARTVILHTNGNGSSV